MPELPEVETTRLGLLPHVQGKRVISVKVRNHRLRWPVPSDLAESICGSTITDIARRGKYLLWACEKGLDGGFLLTHLGMSGTLRALRSGELPAKHDHIDIQLEGETLIRYTDPRRFGAMLWIAGAVPQHPLLEVLGPEPLSIQFNGAYLYAASRGRSVSIKEFIMNGHIVVGVGNIYASESLFHASILPRRAAGKLSMASCMRLSDAICKTLSVALRAGGSSLRDYVKTDGEPGYFQLDAFVYGRAGEACRVCQTTIRSIVQGQRRTFFCPACQH
jgi:formamidopyrimidine-DNA glycosylase